MKRLALGLVTGAAALGLIAGTGVAEAKITAEPDKFPHTTDLTDGTLSITMTNATPWQANCVFRVFAAKDLATVAAWSAAANAWFNGTGTYEDLEIKGAKVKLLQPYKDTLETGLFPAGEQRTLTWRSGRADTSYTVEQACATSSQTGDEIFAYDAYKASGTGAGVATGGGTGGNGILDDLDLFGSLG